MNFATVRGIPVNDMDHVPDYIRIDRLTTESAVLGLFCRNRKSKLKQYKIMDGENCIFIGTASEVAVEYGVGKPQVYQAVKRECALVNKYKVEKV